MCKFSSHHDLKLNKINYSKSPSLVVQEYAGVTTLISQAFVFGAALLAKQVYIFKRSNKTNVLPVPVLDGCSFRETEPGRGCTTAWVTTKTFNDLAPNDEESGIQQLSDVVWGFLTSLALPSSSPTSLQNGSSNGSFPKWEIALIAAAIECANYNANNLQPSISPSMNTPTSKLLSASGMSNNKRERLGFVNRHLRNTRTFLSSSGGSGSATDCNKSLASANTVITTKGFNHDPDSPHRSILATSFTYDKSFGQEGLTLVGDQELELLGQGLKTHIDMTKSLVESLSFSYSSSQLSRITAGSNPKLSPSEFSHNSSPSGNNSTTSS
ncbi:hypothetical protein PPACK8108_LOCUS22431 [Phakopsora pachyrhizi]|uniref:Uncharacterized protein n=1 Tax=Phakopsora pachyrhizi TaxID=170000 RepID=A0AAV0BMB2_PHAPC|nr:hypothetical protein PPACK8108_LOCUS22431 [Phakopsora pachyrhizi]